MANALKIALPFPPKFDNLGKKFHAWWNGVDFKEENNEEILELSPETEVAPENNAQDTQEKEKPALEIVEPGKKNLNNNEIILHSDYLLWGQGRITPLNDYFDTEILKSMQLEKGKKLSVFGGEAGNLAKIALDNYDVKIDLFEQNSFLKDVCEKNLANHSKVKNFSCKAFDGTPGNLPKNKADKLLIMMRGFNMANIESHFFAASRHLKPNGIGFWVDFFAPDDQIDLSKLSQPEGRSFATIEEIMPILAAAGLEIIEEEDVGANFLNGFVANQNKLKENWENIQAEFIKIGGANGANHALQNLMGWRNRADALKIGKLALKKITFCRA